MKIEKISDTQIKFILTQADLAERNIKPTELTYGSDKTHQLFQDMMRQAVEECAFESENTPLMVEAMPIDAESIVVVVTKIADVEAVEQRLSLVPMAKAAARFKRKDLIEPPPEDSKEDSLSVFSFDNLDILAGAAASLGDRFNGTSQAFKHAGRYFLLLQNESEDDRTTGDMEISLYEYGHKHVSNIISRQFLIERAEVLIAENAVEKLTRYFS